jgi:hypothetical protein
MVSLTPELLLTLSALCFAITVPWPAHLSREGLESLAIQLPRMRDMAEQMGVPLSKEAFWGQIPNPPSAVTLDFIESLKAIEESPEVEELRSILDQRGYNNGGERVQELLHCIRPEYDRIRGLMNNPDWHLLIDDSDSCVSIHREYYLRSRWFTIVQGYFALQHAEQGEMLNALDLLEFSYQITTRMLCGKATFDFLVAGAVAGSAQSNLRRLIPFLTTVGEIREARRISQIRLLANPSEYILGSAIDDIVRTSSLEYYDLQFTGWEDMPDFAHSMPAKTDKTMMKYLDEVRKLPVELVRDAYHCLILKANLVLFHPDVRTMEFGEAERTLRQAILALFDSKELPPRARERYESETLFSQFSFVPDWQTIRCSLRVALAMMEARAKSGQYPRTLSELDDLDPETIEEVRHGRVFLQDGGIHVRTMHTFGGVIGPKGIPPIALP